jgi:hypothetical protein
MIRRLRGESALDGNSAAQVERGEAQPKLPPADSNDSPDAPKEDDLREEEDGY